MPSIEETWDQWVANFLPLLESGGMNAEAINWVFADLRPRFFEASLRAPRAAFPGVSAEVHAEIDDCISRTALACMIQMIRIERELYELKFQKSALTPEALARDCARVMPEQPAGSRPN